MSNESLPYDERPPRGCDIDLAEAEALAQAARRIEVIHKVFAGMTDREVRIVVDVCHQARLGDEASIDLICEARMNRVRST